MRKTIDVADLQDQLHEVLDDVVHRRVAYVLARGSDPEAVVIPYDQFQRYQALDSAEAYALLERLQSRRLGAAEPFSEEQVAADVAAAIAEARASRPDAGR